MQAAFGQRAERVRSVGVTGTAQALPDFRPTGDIYENADVHRHGDRAGADRSDARHCAAGRNDGDDGDDAGADPELFGERGGSLHRQGFQERSSRRSEEHTSELQSLMRISYAVFCLQNKNQKISTSPTSPAYKYKIQHNKNHVKLTPLYNKDS